MTHTSTTSTDSNASCIKYESMAQTTVFMLVPKFQTDPLHWRIIIKISTKQPRELSHSLASYILEPCMYICVSIITGFPEQPILCNMLPFVRQLRQQNIFMFGQMRAGDEAGERAFCNLLTITSFLDNAFASLLTSTVRSLPLSHIFSIECIK